MRLLLRSYKYSTRRVILTVSRIFFNLMKKQPQIRSAAIDIKIIIYGKTKISHIIFCIYGLNRPIFEKIP